LLLERRSHVNRHLAERPVLKEISEMAAEKRRSPTPDRLTNAPDSMSP
jgi:hypothetical protein